MASLRVALKRDLRGRVVAVGTAEAPARFARYGYRPDGSILTETLGNEALTRSFSRDPLRRLTGIDDPAFGLALGYRVGGAASGPDADGRVTAEKTAWTAAAFAGPVPAPASRRHGFDCFGRLIGAASPDRPAQALTQCYEADDNILSRAAGGAQASAYAYASGTNRLASVQPPQGTATLLAHEADGAVKAVGAMALRHDGPGGRASGVRTGAASLAYQANAAGERVLKRVTGAGALSRLTVRSGAATLLERQADGREERYIEELCIHGPTGLVALVVDGQDHAVSKDQRGSIRAVWAAGTVAASFDYLSFGALDAGNSQTTSPLAARIRRRYTGQEFEAETGLYNYHARLYDPSLARFLAPDPVRQTPSPYAYVADDPVNFVDPMGMVIERVLQLNGRLLFVDETRQVLAVSLNSQPLKYRARSGHRSARI
jgi:RHS repeat-associated protein